MCGNRTDETGDMTRDPIVVWWVHMYACMSKVDLSYRDLYPSAKSIISDEGKD